jgi:hypothetical protein
MAKGRVPAVGSQQLIDKISEAFNGQVKDEDLPSMVEQLLTMARRPVIAGLVLYDPVMKVVKIQGLLNLDNQVPIELIEAAFSSAVDQIKELKAQQKAENTLKQQLEQKAAASQPQPEETPPQEPNQP